jgi:hypothetical protein
VLQNRLQAVQKQVSVATKDADALQQAEIARAGEFFVPSAELKAKTEYIQQLQQQSDALGGEIFDLHVSNYDTGAIPGESKMSRHGRRATSQRSDGEILNDPMIRESARSLYAKVLRDMHARTAVMTPLDEVNALIQSAKDEIAALEKSRYARQASMLEGIGGKNTDDLDDMIVQRRTRLFELEKASQDTVEEVGVRTQTTTTVTTVAYHESQVEVAVASYQKEIAEVQRYERAVAKANEVADFEETQSLQRELDAQRKRVDQSKQRMNQVVQLYVDSMEHTPHSTNLGTVIDALDDETIAKLAEFENAPRRGVDEYIPPKRSSARRRNRKRNTTPNRILFAPRTRAVRRSESIASVSTSQRRLGLAQSKPPGLAYDDVAKKQGRPLFDSLPPSRREELITREFNQFAERSKLGARPRQVDEVADDWLQLPGDYADAVKRNLLARASLDETAAWYGVEDARKAVADTKASPPWGTRYGGLPEARAANSTLTEADRQVRRTINLARAQLRIDPVMMANEVRHTAGMSDDGFMRREQLTPEVQQRYIKDGRNNMRLVRMRREVLDAATKHINDIDQPDTMRAIPFVRALDQDAELAVGSDHAEPALRSDPRARHGAKHHDAHGGWAVQPNCVCRCESNLQGYRKFDEVRHVAPRGVGRHDHRGAGRTASCLRCHRRPSSPRHAWYVHRRQLVC